MPAGSLTVIDGSWDSATFATLTDLKVANPARHSGEWTLTPSTPSAPTRCRCCAQRRAVTARDYEDIVSVGWGCLTAYCSAKGVVAGPRSGSTPVSLRADKQRRKARAAEPSADHRQLHGHGRIIRRRDYGHPAMLNLSLVVYTWPTIRKSVVLNAVRNAIINDNVYEKLRQQGHH